MGSVAPGCCTTKITCLSCSESSWLRWVHAVQFWAAVQYQRRSDVSIDDITGKTGPAELMHATACTRINSLLDTHRQDCSFSVHPSRQPSTSQVISPTQTAWRSSGA